MTPHERTMERINAICAEHGVTLSRVLGYMRTPRDLMPVRREIASYLCNERRMSRSRAGAILRRDHSTVTHLLRRT
jgi:chromosomal replication initiation ATPase DnaA